jgi:hypothetical protein
MLSTAVSDKVEQIRLYIFKLKMKYPYKFYGACIVCLAVLLFFAYKTLLTQQLLKHSVQPSQQVLGETVSLYNIGQYLVENKFENATFQGQTPLGRKVRSDVGFVDLRILTLEDFFNSYNSPLAPHADEFIEASDRYGVENWQLLPAIGMAETRGCQTGLSHEQRNCWGWGGSEPNRWVFNSYEDAIDIITARMIKGYSNKYLNAKDIQPTYCGSTCMQWGWRWAKGVDYYVKKINDFGEKYKLPRTNEITDWS